MERGWTPALVVNTPGFASCTWVQIDGFPMRTTWCRSTLAGAPRSGSHAMPTRFQSQSSGCASVMSTAFRSVAPVAGDPGGPFDPIR